MMDKPENIPAGKHCRGKTFTCPWLYDGNWCELLTWEYKSEDELVDHKQPDDCGGVRLGSCLAAYPNGATVTITPKAVIKVPKLGDTVTWRDSDTGGMLSGVVVTVHMVGVQVATNRGGGNVGYNLVLNDDVIHIQPRELLEGGAT